MMHRVKSSDKRRRGQLENLAQKMQELNPNTSENYSTVCVCVCVCVCVRARAHILLGYIEDTNCVKIALSLQELKDIIWLEINNI